MRLGWRPAAWLGFSLMACSGPRAPADCAEPAASSAQSAPAAARASQQSPPAVASRPAAKAPAPVAPRATLFEPGLDESTFMPRAAALELGVDGAALDQLIAEAEKTKSDSLIVIKDGKLLAERYFGRARRPIETMSVTKSFAAIAVALLVADGKIGSLDESLSLWYPEFAAPPKSGVTLRHLLTQTSALEHESSARRINVQGDRLGYARRLKLDGTPGERFSYNNEATQLLSGVIQKAAGQAVDTYLQARLFKPLGITDWQWDRDKAGNVQTYYGLALHARDLAKVGLLLVEKGRYQGKQVIPESWVSQLTAPSAANPYYGLLWWLRYQRVVQRYPAGAAAGLKSAGFSASSALAGLVDHKFESAAAFWLESGSRLSKPQRAELATLVSAGTELLVEEPDNQWGFYADGWLGQRLAVFPGRQLIVVRQHRRLSGTDAEQAECGFSTLLELSERLTPEPKAH